MKIACSYPFSLVLTAVIWVVSLIPIPETPLDNVSMIDKWTHLAMYGLLALTIGLEHRKSHRPASGRWLLVWGWVAPMLMGGLLELLQATCTGGQRNGDWLDFAANAVGATLGWLTGSLLARCLSKGNRDS